GIREAVNTTRLLAAIRRGQIPPGSLIVADEGSMIFITHLAAITEYAARNGCKLVLAGDQEQLAAVEGGGAMMLLADRVGYVQLAEGAEASAGDLVICRVNDHRLEAGEPGRALANGDILRIEAISHRGIMVRRMLDADPATGQRRFTDRAFRYTGYPVVRPGI